MFGFSKERDQDSTLDLAIHQEKENIKKISAARKEWEAKCKAALDSYVPTGPAFKITQTAEGPYIIERRRVVSPREWGGGFMGVLDYEERAVGPYEQYETVRNVNAPIMRERPRYDFYGGRPIAEGYSPMFFNVFKDAEEYLFRMAQPAETSVGYDFPPLTKREAD